jgi:hypothetical protein
MTALKALSCAVAIAFAAPYAASAAAPKPPPPKPPPPGSNPYLAPPQTDATSAYQFRTRILFSPPSCQDFAGQADRVFYNGTLDDKAKAEQLTAVGNAAAAAGCLGR